MILHQFFTLAHKLIKTASAAKDRVKASAPDSAAVAPAQFEAYAQTFADAVNRSTGFLV